ncbi:MAG TPA: sigma-70 family RNA polymerase sigma factor, partial [Candidatus Binatia bacterium]|nr:sigma-70 family RNA polymerase sigma factor [Candidatus Binatia bacterium]
MNQTAQQDLRDEEIVALCQQGRSEVFEVLVRKYMEKAFRIAFDFTHDTEEAKDLSQEAFLRAFSRIKQFDGRSSFYTWFYRLVVNICLDHTRRKGRVIWERLEMETEGSTERVELADGSSLPDEEVVALCQQGRSEVFEVLVRKYMEKAFRIAFDFTHDTEEAKDLSQ